MGECTIHIFHYLQRAKSGVIIACALRKASDATIRGVAQLGSALRSGRRGRQFKSGHPDFYNSKSSLQVLAASFCALCLQLFVIFVVIAVAF